MSDGWTGYDIWGLPNDCLYCMYCRERGVTTMVTGTSGDLVEQGKALHRQFCPTDGRDMDTDTGDEEQKRGGRGEI